MRASNIFLKGRSGVLPVVAAVMGNTFAFGALGLVGMGGIPLSTEAAGSAFGGQYGPYFKMDARGHCVPAIAGAGTYGAAWTPPIPSGTVSIFGASGRSYTVVIQADTAHIREMYATAANADTTSTSQLNSTLAVLTNTTAKTILCRDGTMNPTNLSYELDSPRAAGHYTGTARITVKSENRDTGLDYAGNPRLAHGFKTGSISWSSNADLIEYVDFVDVHFTASVAGPSDLFRMPNVGGHNPFGINFTTCRFDYTGGTSAIDGPNVNGPCYFKNCQFVNLGGGQQGHGIVCNTDLTVWDCIFDGMALDGIDISGGNNSIRRNLFKNTSIGNGDHGDAIQIDNILHTTTVGSGYTPGFYPAVPMSGGGTTGITMDIAVKPDGTVLATNLGITIAGTPRETKIVSKGSVYVEGVTIKATNDAFDGGVGDRGFRLTTRVSPNLGDITDNIIIADQGAFGAAQGIFFSNIDYPINLLAGIISGNIIHTTAGNGLYPMATSGIAIQFNWVLFDPFRTEAAANVNLGTGGSFAGADITLNYNGANAINTTTWSGTKTENPTEANQTYIASTRTKPQIISDYQTIFSNYPSTQADYLARAQTYAGALSMFIPNKTLKSSGGAMLAGNFYNGRLFPDGTHNDGNAYAGA
jgi:hypothetical protein